MKRLPGALLTILLLSSCASRSNVPAVVNPLSSGLPETWTGERFSTVVDHGGEVSWERLLSEPVLADLVGEAIRNNPSLTAAAARVHQASAQALIVGADRYPHANASFDGARRKQNFIGFPIPGAEDQVFSTTTTTWGVGLNVSWEVDLWGRIRAGHRAAMADLDAVRADFHGARLSLAGQTVKAWLSAVEARQQVELARETLASRRTTEAGIDRRYREGLAPSIDLRLARTNRSVSEATLAGRERQLDAAKRQLEILLGRYPRAAVEAADRLPELPSAVPAGIPAELISRRPDLIAAERRLAASNARLVQARAALYPQFRLTGSAGTSTDEIDNLLDGDFSVWSFAFNLLQPVFQGGKLRANIDLHEAIEDEVAAAFVEQALRAFAEVELAIVAEASLAQQESALENAVESAVAAQRSAEERYAAGLADYLLVLETQRQTLDAKSRLIDVRRQRLTALVDLCIAIGGELESDSLADPGEIRS